MRNILLFAALLLAAPVTRAQDVLAVAEIQILVDQYMDAHKRGDADAKARLFTDTVVYINAHDGSSQIRTAEENKARFVRHFCDNRDERQITIKAIEFLPNGLARITGRFVGTETNKATGRETTYFGTYENLLKQIGGYWKICQVKATID